MAKTIKWLGKTKCDICDKPITHYLYDARTAHGPWATMCIDCYSDIGMGLGTGYGQRYEQQDDGSFLKVEG